MAEAAPLRVELGDDGVALIVLDDPARKVNVTSPALVAALMAALERVAVEPGIVGAVLTSAKPGSFVAGGDIADFVGAHDRGMSGQEAFELSHRWNVDLRRIERCGKPIAAALNGVALGGGLELALCCGHRVLADDPRALVGLPEVTIGLLPAGGGSQRLPRLVGIEAALDLMLAGTRLAPARALELGLVDAVVPPEAVVGAARRWVLACSDPRQPWDRPGYALPGAAAPDWYQRRRARVLAETRGHYPAPLALLEAVHEGTARPIEEGLRVESRCFAGLLPGAVARNLMRTGFVNRALGKRFTARDGAPPAASAALVGRIEGAPGRYVDRLWQAYLAEGVALLNDGFARAQIEDGAQASGLAVGPLAAAAAIGRETPAPAAARALHGDSVATRLLAAPALEAVRCLEEGLLEDPALADVGSVVALGYPRWTGGVLSWIETLGLPVFVLECDRLALRCGPRFAVPPALRERARTGRKFYAAPTA